MSGFFKKLFQSGESKRKIDDPEDPRLLRIHAERLIQRDITKLTGICELYLAGQRFVRSSTAYAG